MVYKFSVTYSTSLHITVPASLREWAPHDTAKVCPAAEVRTKALASTPRATDRTLKKGSMGH
jgi:hypothetical protein